MVVEATQLVQGALLIPTLRPLAIVAPHVLLLSEAPLLQAYAPTYRPLVDPP